MVMGKGGILNHKSLFRLTEWLMPSDQHNPTTEGYGIVYHSVGLEQFSYCFNSISNEVKI